jgi:hypothetical protein
MLRSVIAVTAGVLVGVTIFIYGAFIVAQTIPATQGAAPDQIKGLMSLPPAGQLGVVGVWFLSTLSGSLVASIAARRWAPVSWIVAATMGLFAVTNFASDPAPFWVQALSIIAIAAAGWTAIKVTSACYEAPPGAPKPPL